MMINIKTLASDIFTKFVARIGGHSLDLDFSGVPLYLFEKPDIDTMLSTNVVLKTPRGFFRPIRLHADLASFQEESFSFAKEVIEDDDHLERFMQACLYDWKLNPHKGYHSFSANRILGTYEVAKFLGLECLYPKVELCRIRVGNGKERIGTMMEPAAGIYPLNLKERLKEAVCPTTQKILSKLQIMDAICYEKDHKPGNYNIVVGGGKIVAISVFDNDCPWTFFPSCSPVFKNYQGASPVIKKGTINLPYLDNELGERIIGADIDELKGVLEPYLNKMQLRAICSRFWSIKKAVTKSFEEKDYFLLTEKQWTEDCMKEQLENPVWGNSYLKILYNRWEYIKEHYPWVLKNHNLD